MTDDCKNAQKQQNALEKIGAQAEEKSRSAKEETEAGRPGEKGQRGA